MQGRELYELWAPTGALWSAWVKPVAFAHIQRQAGAGEPERALESVRGLELPWAPSHLDGCGVVLDIPGADAVRFGLALALRGFQPVLLHNTTPNPFALIELGAVEDTLRCSEAVMRAATFTSRSPPAFILDSRRMAAEPKPRSYDNRWMTFPQDFPSGATLLRGGVREILLVLEKSQRPADDLRHVLLRWQKAGVALSTVERDGDAARTRLEVTRPAGFFGFWRRAAAAAGLRRNSAGGFGAVVPEPSESSSRVGGFG